LHAWLRYILLPLLLLALPGWAGEARHTHLYAVPRPGKVVVDAKLDDWDLSGTLVVYGDPATREMQSARVAVMYDADALFLSAVVKDPTPLVNHADPKGDPARVAEGDLLRLSLRGEVVGGVGRPTRILARQLDCWYFTDRKAPCLRVTPLPVSKPALPAVAMERFEAAYAPAANGRGYALEYRIPWDTLGVRTPEAEHALPATLQVAWGGALVTELREPAGVPYHPTREWGTVQFMREGRLPVALTHAGLPPEPPLPLTFAYTLPRNGEVTLALHNAAGQPVRHLLAQAPRAAGEQLERWDGLDDAGKPLPPGAYAWKGLVHDPITTRYLCGIHNAGQPSYATPDGTGAWGADHGVPSTVCAVGDGMLLAWTGAEAGWGLIRTDLAGHKQWGLRNGAEHLACDGDRLYAAGGFGYLGGSGISVYSAKDGRPLTFGRNARAAEPAGGEEGANVVTGLAYANGTLYASYAKRNLIVLYDARQGTIRETWSVLAPERLAVRPDGALAVISRGGVLAVTRVRQTPLAADHLDDPVAVTAGPDGLVYVANRGALQNVSVFDPAGKFVVNIGRKGGRPRVGKFDQSGMLEPGGIALDAQGRLWVAETLDSPKRISVWDTNTGACITEFFGAGHYATFVSMDPAREDEAYCHNTIWSMDLDKGTWYPLSTLWRQITPDDPPACQELRVFTAKNGHQYAWGRWNYARALYLRAGALFKPVLVTLTVAKDNPYIAWPPVPAMADRAKFPDGCYVWQDGNDDLRIQADEIVRVAGARSGFYGIDPGLTLTWSDGVQYRPARLAVDGTPVYDFALPIKSPLFGRPDAATCIGSDPADGSWYLLDEDGLAGPRGFARLAKDGKLLWRYPRTGSWRATLGKPLPQPGQMWGVTQPLGVAGAFTGVATYFGTAHLFTRDGLYVAALRQDARAGGTGAEALRAESFAGQLVRLRQSGRYLLLGGDTDGRIAEILGLDSVQRFGGSLTLTAADTARVQAPAPLPPTPPPALTIRRGRAALAQGAWAVKAVDENGFSAALAYDARSLYVAMAVRTTAPFTNSQADPRILFTGGNCIDLQLATDPTADPKRTAPAPGDLRVLVTLQRNKPVAVLYRPRADGLAAAPVTLRSPTGQERFDAITVLDKVEVELRPAAGGFTAVVALPLDALGWTPQPGTPVRLDLGYLFGDAAGTRCARRAYLFNTSPTAAITHDIPAESRLAPSQWGSVAVE
jgi:hypothetical protein